MVRVTVSPEGAEEAPSDAWLETLLEAAPEGGSGLRGFIVVQQQHHQHNDQYNDQGGDS